jgi:hypothetical protein
VVGATKSQTPLVPGQCGNGQVEGTEQCDPGVRFKNGHIISLFKGQSCCNLNCKWQREGAPCGKGKTTCFRKSRCQRSGGAATCVPGAQKAPNAVCRITRRRLGRCTSAGVCQ